MSETRRTLKYMLKTAGAKRPGLFVLYLLMFMADVTSKLQAVLLPKLLIDQVVAILNGASRGEHVRLAVIYSAVTVGLTFITSFMKGTCSHFKNIEREWFNEYFELELAGHTMQMDYEHTEDPNALDQIAKAKEGISWYSGGVVGILDCLYDAAMNVTVLLGVFAVILFTCPLLLPVLFLSLFAMLFFNSRNNQLEVEQFKKLAKVNRVCGYVFWQLADFSYGKEIRLYDSANMMKNKEVEYTKEQIGIWRDTARKQRKNSWGIDLANACRDGFTYLYIGLLAIRKSITIGDFSMCISSASTLYWSLFAITSGWQEIVKRCSYAYQFLKFLEYPKAMKEGEERVTKKTHEIEFRNVSFRYPRSETFVLRKINLKIRSGEHLSVVGLNGAGKTTFIKLLCRLYDVTEGMILVDGKDIRKYSQEDYRRLFAVIFQDFQLFAFSLKENVLVGAAEDKARVEQVLKLSGLYEDAMKLDCGLDTILYKSFDEHGTELSGGQKQKTAISRALYRNAPIVILDEPTAALDPVAEYDIYRQFNQLVGGKTAIYISHRLSSCKFCDKIAVFAEDTIREYGTHEELVAKKDGIYARMFAAQAQYYVDYAS